MTLSHSPLGRLLLAGLLAVGLLLPAAMPAAADSGCWKTLGITTPVLDLPVGRQMVEALKAGGTDDKNAIVYGQSYLESGSTIPREMALDSGKSLQKIVPQGNPPSAYTGYWATPDVMERELGTPASLAQHFALPPAQAAATVYDVYEIAATQGVTVFQSTVAPTSDCQTGQTETGGAEQTLVMNRALFTAPQKLKSVSVQ